MNTESLNEVTAEEQAAADRLDAALNPGPETHEIDTYTAELLGLAGALVTPPAARHTFVAALEKRLEEAFDARPVRSVGWPAAPRRSRLVELLAVGCVAGILAAGAYFVTARDPEGAVATAVAATETATPTVVSAVRPPQFGPAAPRAVRGAQPPALVAALPSAPDGTPTARGMP